MLITILRAKIHRARITNKELHYEGSLSVGKDLLQESGMLVGEKIQIVNFNNGNRFETYLIEGEPGEIGLRGPAALLGEVGDIISIFSYALATEEEAKVYQPKALYVDEKNQPLKH